MICILSNNEVIFYLPIFRWLSFALLLQPAQCAESVNVVRLFKGMQKLNIAAFNSSIVAFYSVMINYRTTKQGVSHEIKP